MKESLLRTVHFVSGGGTTTEAVIKSAQNGILHNHVQPVAVIADRYHIQNGKKREIEAIYRAEELKIPTKTILKKEFPSAIAYEEAVLSYIKSLGDIDALSLNGLLSLLPNNVIQEYETIINQHPGPLRPQTRLDFGGKGMYGKRVTAAVIAYMWATGTAEPQTESTIHHVTRNFDEGELIQVYPMAIPENYIPFSELSLHPDLVKEASITVAEKLLQIEHANVN